MNDLRGPVLLYDGHCGFCDGVVRVLLRIDRREVLRFSPLQGEFAREVLGQNRHLKDVDSLVLVDGPGADGTIERVSVRSDAFLRTLRHLGGIWKVLLVLSLVPRPLRDWAYDLFARHRYRLFGRYEACPIPPPEVRARFLD